MKKLITILFVLIISLTLIKYIQPVKNTPTLTINNKTFNIDIARTDEQKAKGLSIYNKLSLNKGMIFIFDSSDYYTFWMKDMKFPIDIIYIKKNLIVDIFKNVPNPKSENETLSIIRPKSDADIVFELNAGLSEKYNFKIGNTVKINY